MLLGYNTNGFAHHRLADALEILAELGYQSVALTLDHQHLDPFAATLSADVRQVLRHLERLSLACVIETGARFLLDPRRKHQPTLLSADPDARQIRRDFLVQSMKIAHDLGSGVISFWSGTPDDTADPHTHLNRLRDGCRWLCEEAEKYRVRLAFEPEPGMFIDTMTRFAELHRAVDHPAFGLTIDIGHLHCLGETPIADQLRRWQHLLWNIHIEDMRPGIHDHLMFGEGDIDFPPIFAALRDIGYRGGVHVELSRHSHNAVEMARQSLAFLQSLRQTVSY